MLKLDMHVHSTYSKDSIFRINDMFKKFKKTGILPMVCDHNSIQGSIEFGKLLKGSDYPIIYNEEIETIDGEIIGIFLTEEIKRGLSVEETLDIIHGQGGLAIVPHPFDGLRSTVLKKSRLDEFINKIDFVEGYNSRNVNSEYNTKAINYAIKNKKPITCGSDSHTYHEFGKTHVELPWFIDKNEFIKSFRASEIHHYKANKLAHVTSKALKICRKMKIL